MISPHTLHALQRRRVPSIAFGAVAYLLAFGRVMWLWMYAVAAVEPEELRGRLLSLYDQHGALEVSADGADTLRVSLRREIALDRTHTASLRMQPTKRRVLVRERLGASGARPRNVDEAGMRASGEAAFDPARPSANRVSRTMVQTTIISPERLSKVPLRFEPMGSEIDADYTNHLDGEGMVTLLCAIVVQSGWDWQPSFTRGG